MHIKKAITKLKVSQDLTHLNGTEDDSRHEENRVSGVQGSLGSLNHRPQRTEHITSYPKMHGLLVGWFLTITRRNIADEGQSKILITACLS